MLIDESHNLRNREGKRYRAIHQYIERNECRCILLSATPYNKSYLDLANQLRLFIDPEINLGTRPERLIRELGIVEFNRRFENIPTTSLLAFEKSESPGDWQELLRHYMVRRTRTFIRENYADEDENGRFLSYPDGRKDYFPTRHPRRLDFTENEQYARLYRPDVVDTINDLNLPRYGLGLYAKPRPTPAPTDAEKRTLDDLSRGGKRLMGFSRTNLFKRLESSGHAFSLSVERHILRNYVFIHALENDLPLPIGTQDVALLDTRFSDEDGVGEENGRFPTIDPATFQTRAAAVYELYATQYKRRFKWLRANLFKKTLKRDLKNDALDLMTILLEMGNWDPAQDAQLNALADLLTTTSQFDILSAAECNIHEQALPHTENHHDLQKAAVRFAREEQQAAGVQLGRASGARFKTYERMKSYLAQSPLFADLPENQKLKQAIEQMGKNRLMESARDKLNRQLRSGISNEQLSRIVITLFEEKKLCIVHEQITEEQPKIICSLGLQ